MALAALDADLDGVVEVAEMRVRQQTPAERTAHVLDEFDTNHDGTLSREEVPDGMRPRFAGADVNQNGSLDRDELLHMFATMQPPAGGESHPDAAPAITQPKGH